MIAVPERAARNRQPYRDLRADIWTCTVISKLGLGVAAGDRERRREPTEQAGKSPDHLAADMTGAFPLSSSSSTAPRVRLRSHARLVWQSARPALHAFGAGIARYV